MRVLVAKECARCGEMKPAAEFPRRGASVGRTLDSYCKACRAALARSQRATRPERQAALSKAWYQANRGRAAWAHRAWHEENPEAVAEIRARRAELRRAGHGGASGAWRADETRFLVEHIDRWTLTEVAAALGRTLGSVESKARRLRRSGAIA